MLKASLKILIVFSLIPVFAFAQKKKTEFEGIIRYNHKVIAKDSSYNVEYDYAGIGKNSDYFYKNGNYKFVNYNAYFKADIFNSAEKTDYLLLSNSDTILCVDTRIPDLEVLEYSIKKSAATILNHKCNLLTLKLKPIDQAHPVSYRRYYYSNKLPINPSHFKACKGNAYEFIFENTKSLPLKIEFEWPNRTIIWEAYEVIQKDLNEDTFQLDKKLVLLKIN